jgi:signal peptidase I
VTVRFLTTLALVVVFGLAAILLIPAVLGYERYVITSGSMTGTYDPGSIVFDKEVPVAALEKGDVITYGPPGAHHRLVTHRIVSIRRIDGRLAIRTKGDANDSPDPYEFTPERPTIARVEASLPHLGRVYSALNDRLGRLIVFAAPALLIAVAGLTRLWREAGADMRRREVDQT